ncbi:hypothetical protein EB118_15185 [bacterium]|nr:hypothetical protein [Actinomycetota bacterium]NDG31398.1 hypothetical protein [bacterium]
MEIERKRLAIVITGHLRTFKKHFNDFKKNILDHHDCDLYLSTWDSNHIGVMAGASLVKYEQATLEKELNIYPNIKKITISPYKKINHECDEYIKSYGEFGTCPDPFYKKYIGGRVERKTMPYNAGQWYPVQEGFKSIDNPEQYDILMRTRFDIHHYKPIKFLSKDIVACHPGPKRRPNSHLFQTDLYNIKNHIFYGTPYLVEVMKNIFQQNLKLTCQYTDLCTDSLLEYIFRNNSAGYELTIDSELRESVEYGVWK